FGAGFICLDQATCSQECSAEVSYYNQHDIGYILADQLSQNGPARCTGWFSVVRNPLLGIGMTQSPCETMMPGFWMYRSDFLEKFFSLFFSGNRADVSFKF